MTLAATVVAIVLLWGDTARAMVAIWWRSETYAHAFLVPPIVAWLGWRSRARWLALSPRPQPWLLVAVALAVWLWLMGQLAAVAAASQFMLVGLVVLSVPVLMGWSVARALAFPLAFLFFAVPVGEFLVPALIDHTADFTVWALRASGIPVYREGNQFVIPSGAWSVVEACSGVRYLIASLMVGTLYAYLNYSSLPKRVAFVVVAIAVPIVANWLRAYMIVMLGHLSGNTLAVGVDHLLYGWVFFGIVVGLMFWIGARWADVPAREGDTTAAKGEGGEPRPTAQGAARAVGTALACLALVAAAAAAWWQVETARSGPVPPFALPELSSQGWAMVDGGPSWEPGYAHPSRTAQQAYASGTRTIWLWVGYYRDQGEGRKLVSTSNQLVLAGSSGWMQVGGIGMWAPQGGVPVARAELREALPLTGAAPNRLRVHRLYWVDGHFMAGEVQAKLRQAWSRLMGRGDDGAVLLLGTVASVGAEEELASFLVAAGPALSRLLDNVRTSH